MLSNLFSSRTLKQSTALYFSFLLSIISVSTYATDKQVSSVAGYTASTSKSSDDVNKAPSYSPIPRKLHQQIISMQIKPQKSNTNRQQLNAVQLHQGDFIIYDAFSYLETDVDGDGYHQSFSIVFDADYFPYSYSDYADVYASLYLSRNGGPWEHYYSSEVFTLYLDSDEDEYEVSTTLEQGYLAGNYDILIDLYHADTNTLVTSYSSDDNNALYALPLESAEHDVVYVNEVVVSHGGSFYSLLILCLSTALIRSSKRVLKQ